MVRYSESRRKSIQEVILLLFAFLIVMSSIFSINTIHADSTKSSHIVMDADTNTILSGDNIHARLPMASTTKVMTAYVAITKGNLQDKVTITHDMVGIEGSSIYLKEGEILLLEDLVYGLMLRSGNDSAVAIAMAVGGTVEGFVNMMNEEAKAMGLKDTHFMNPHGLHHEEHFTSAYDLAIIASNAMQNDKFKEIVGTKSRIVDSENGTRRYLVNKNKILSLYEYGNGIKTGFTKRAGRCLVSSAKKGNMQLVSVVLNEPNMWEYSISSMDKAFSEYITLDIVTQDEVIATKEIDGRLYNVVAHESIKHTMKREDIDKLTYDIVINENIKYPKSGENVGKLLVYMDNHLIFDVKIYTI